MPLKACVHEWAPKMKKIVFPLLLAGLGGCAHESVIAPSQGHVSYDAKPAVVANDIPKPVTKPSYVPPPKPRVKEATYSVVVNDVPVREILFALARESKVNVDIHPAITGRVTLNAVDQTLPAILDRISRQVDLRYKLEGNVLSVTPDLPTLHTYRINYVNMDRDTASSIGVAAQISSTGVAASTSGNSTSSGSGNSSATTVNSKSKNNFWEALTENIHGILKSTKTQVANTEEKAARNEAVRSAKEDRLKQVEAVSRAGAGAEKLYQEAFKSQPSDLDSKDEVILNPVAGTLTVMATERQHGFIQQYVDAVMSSVQRQVLIETTIVEVELSDQFQTGIDWSRLGTGRNQGFNFQQTLGGVKQTTGNQFVVGYVNNATPLGNLAASLRMLETFGNTRVLSSPKLMALNNQTAILKVVDNLVYFTAESSVVAGNTNTNNAVSTTTTPHTVPVGVVMSVTPQISEVGGVTLNVRPTISRKVGEVSDPNPNLTNIKSSIPQIQIREMESVLQVESGQTVVLGGLMQDDVSKNTDAVPGVSRLPIIGKLFQGKNDTVKKTELVIFLRPTVISKASLESDELSGFKQFLPDQLPDSANLTLDEPAH